MYQLQVQYIINFLMLADALAMIFGVFTASHVNWIVHNYDWKLDGLDSGYISLFLVLANNYILGQMGLYSSKRPTKFIYTIRDILVSTLILFALLSGLLLALKIDTGRLFIVICASIVIVLLIAVRAALEMHLTKQAQKGYNCHNILIVGSLQRILVLNEALKVQSSWGHKVIGYLHESLFEPTEGFELSFLGNIEELPRVLLNQNIDEVIFALSSESSTIDIKKCIEHCEEVGTSYRIVPSLYDPLCNWNIRVESIQGIPTLVKNTIKINASGMLYKRALDYACGSVGFLIFLCLYPLVGLLIKLDSSGPILFCQKRVGEHGRIFTMFKFRTMVCDAENRITDLVSKNQMTGFMFKMDSDPRITKIGAFLRKTSLDEFPQFINVILGEMSIVGTRPPTVEEVAQYESRHRRRIAIKPGITGLWQVSGRSKIIDFEQVLKLDLQYIDNWRFLDDIHIILRTIQVVLMRKGAM